MDYSVVICSHDRSTCLANRTLSVLRNAGIPFDKIFVFVAPEEMEVYAKELPGVTIRQGALGLRENRHAACLAFPVRHRLVFLDDDVRAFVRRGPDNRLAKVSDLDAVFQEGFRYADLAGCSLWGFYPVANAKWLKNSISDGLVFLYGCAFGLFNRHDLKTDSDFKEDYERCLLAYEKEGKMIRLNWVAPIQSYRSGKGGLNESRTYDKEVSECMKLQNRFPDLVKLRHKKDRVDIVFPRKLVKSVPMS
jgi:hypothetical protein